MPQFNEQQLIQISEQILQGAGVPADDAKTVAHELKEANLVGHDSHGVMRLMQYVDYIDQGFICPGEKPEVVLDKTSFAVVDGHSGFGQVIADLAISVGTQKAKETGTASVFIRNCNHVGRLGSYSQQVALRGFASMMCVNAPGPGGVAPYGGIERRLGTNPISISAPRKPFPLVLDMTSSATAEGKVRVSLQKGEQVPEGWIIDSEGNSTTDPAKLYGPPQGAILPLGGPLGFKGFGLSVMIDFFGGILSGAGVCRTDVPPGANGVWMYFVDVSQLVDEASYSQLVDQYVTYLKSSKRQPGVDEILMPGEIEHRRREERAAAGVVVPDETWRQINGLAEKLGVSLSV